MGARDGAFLDDSLKSQGQLRPLRPSKSRRGQLGSPLRETQELMGDSRNNETDQQEVNG
jgi:hypothetical protein